MKKIILYLYKLYQGSGQRLVAEAERGTDFDFYSTFL